MAPENRLKILQQAEKFFKQGKTEAAVKEYQRILEIKPDDLEIRRIVGDLKLKLNKIPEAISQFQWIADYYLREGFFTKAIAMYKRITRIDPQNEEISNKLADLYSKQGLIIDAKQIYMEMVEEYKRQNNPKKALGIYKKILEFDRNNVKMRLLLAENYLREGMGEEAVNEYAITSDILIKKKDFKQAEEILQDTYKKIKNLKILEKLISCHISQGDEKKAIQLLVSLGDDIFNHPTLLKILGELYFGNNSIEEAEKIYKKISEIDPNETEVIMKLGKVYLQREEYDKAFQLFLPIIDKFIEQKKYDDANSLLRFIITSNNTYLPALKKLASVFKLTGKTNSLIAIYESLIPIYEQRKMKNESIAVLEELIGLSGTPYTYQEQLNKLTGTNHKDESEKKQELEFVSFHLKSIQQALDVKDYKKANNLLLTAKNAFPKNLDIRLKLFDFYQLTNDVDSLLNEGIELLLLYRELNKDDEYKDLFETLNRLKPNDEKLLDLSGHEKTNIEIDFDRAELIEQISELQHPGIGEIDFKETKEEEDVLVLNGEDSVANIQSKLEKEFTKGLSSQLVELDFYISEGYFDNAEMILGKLSREYPESKEIIARLEKVKKSKDLQITQRDASKAPPVPEEDLRQQLTNSKSGLADEERTRGPMINVSPDNFAEIEGIQFEMESEKPEAAIHIPHFEIEKNQVPQPPASSTMEKTSSDILGSSSEFLNFNNILAIEESPAATESPFKDIDDMDLAIESEDDLLKSDMVFLDEEKYYESETKVTDEISAIQFWIKELEKQRTSTIEKNMMEIFKEFKKGVDEKIGHEDYDTRYNLGIAYKEMGLLEEAIHEFLISAKHPLKFFDSAGLLGICFREKGMLDESVTWFEKALESPERREEEYKAIKYELIVTARLKEDYSYSKKLAQEILKVDPKYRNIREIFEEIKNK